MNMPEKYIKKVQRWAYYNEGILGLALIGSYARHQAKPESDIDFMIICGENLKLENDLSWINRFGKVKSCNIENWGIVTSIRVFYKDGQEIEFGIASKEWANLPVDVGTHRVISDGMIILKDSIKLLSALQETISE
jgi:predicted nucleotidyltransferase